ncbi:mechanosensitive ion channel domain-containing protein [Salinarimonas rosea]|uniref:mechanosensitive ion channel domain-containing protein n=1 Tax=Salinarimonas rosea TaxID=552063 RepID=UPI0004169294|nr:mechanosensitive ion channel domain-containing protein [Salinarimonas rosea]
MPPELLQLLSLDVVASALLVAGLLVVRILAIRFVRTRAGMPDHVQRRSISAVKNGTLILLLVGLALIWAPQLRTFALSLTAVAVALVVATKELIACLSGALLRASSRPFSVGDWVEIGEVRGEVVDHDMLATRIDAFAAGPGGFQRTGEVITVPNSVFLSTPIRRLSALRAQVVATTAVVVDPPGLGPDALRAAVEDALVTARAGGALWEGEPSVRFSTTDLGRLRIEVTLTAPTRSAETAASAVTLAVLAALRPPAA